MIFEDEFSKIIIVGAGPAGCAASLFLSQKKIKHTIIEKEQFPRDKICGDAISGKVLNILNKIDKNIVNEIITNKKIFKPSNGIIFCSPDFTKVEIPFGFEKSNDKKTHGFVAKRLDFDNFLFEKIDKNFCRIIQNCSLVNAEHKKESIAITVNVNNQTYQSNCKILVAADGAHSVVSKKLTNFKIDYRHYSAGMRAYFKGVKDLSNKGFIELIFLKEYLPGYFWIFPLPDDRANVGVGMLSQSIKDKKIDLKKMFEDTIQNNIQIKKRFENSVQETPLLGWGLPMGSKKIKLSGNNLLLCGDAASLIDPFTGEGIAPAMLSGKLASDTIADAILANNFTADFLNKYDEAYYKATRNETKISNILQKLIKYERLFNFVIKKIAKNKELQNIITAMFADIKLRKSFTNPFFYIKLLFKN